RTRTAPPGHSRGRGGTLGMAGAHPEDARALAERDLSRLRAATYELSWLLSRGYASALASSG
ncbi:MAG: hypothetical protein AAFU79_30665, partial [Myxococcota bacterium]